MIFQQWKLILLGLKWQTRRLPGLSDFFWVGDGWHGEVPIQLGAPPDVATLYTLTPGRKLIRKHYVGQQVAIQPKRGAPAIWVRANGDFIEHPRIHDSYERTWMRSLGYLPAHAKIIALRVERLHEIAPDDAVAEGVADIRAYTDLWEAINRKRPGARWADNPEVIVYTLRYAA